MSLTATRALYIKLGEGNRWAKPAFESNTLRFGFADVSHDVALAAVATKDFTPVKHFYEQDRGVAQAPSSLWPARTGIVALGLTSTLSPF
jgi:hypothetical protein